MNAMEVGFLLGVIAATLFWVFAYKGYNNAKRKKMKKQGQCGE